jgi:hypothetical protein
MGIVSPYPESGVRVDATRSAEGPPWQYVGEAVVPTARFDLKVTVSADGQAAVELPADAPAGLGERVRLIVRTAFKHARDDGAPPPRRIVRWRPDR